MEDHHGLLCIGGNVYVLLYRPRSAYGIVANMDFPLFTRQDRFFGPVGYGAAAAPLGFRDDDRFFSGIGKLEVIFGGRAFGHFAEIMGLTDKGELTCLIQVTRRKGIAFLGASTCRGREA